MTVKELIKQLQTSDQDKEVCLKLGKYLFEVSGVKPTSFSLGDIITVEGEFEPQWECYILKPQSGAV